MNSNIIYEYILSGLTIRPEPKEYRKMAVAPFLLVMLAGVIPGVVLGSYWLFLSLIMVVSSLSITIAVYIISFKNLSILNRLIMQALIYTNWVLQIIMIQTMFYTMVYGFDLLLVFLCVSPILIPLCVGMKNAKRLKNDIAKNIAQTAQNVGGSGAIVGLTFGWTGIVGMFLGEKLSKNLSNEAVIILIVILLAIVSAAMSLGLLAYQRIYYYKKNNILE